MPRREMLEDDWDDLPGDDGEDLPEGVSPRGQDEEDTVPCPYCGRPIHEESERCPHCEQYISEEDALSGQPLWIVIGALLCLFVVVMWVLGG